MAGQGIMVSIGLESDGSLVRRKQRAGAAANQPQEHIARGVAERIVAPG